MGVTGQSPVRRPRRGPALIALAGLGVLAVLGLAPAAAVTASRMPEPLAPAALAIPTAPLNSATGIRSVPVGLQAGTRVQSVDDVRPYAVAAAGEEGAARLLDALTAAADGTGEDLIESAGYDYPYRYPVIEEVLDTVPPDRLRERGPALGAALTLLAAERDLPYGVPSGAARIAFSVLDHARTGGGCDAQVNLLVLVASDAEVDDDVVGVEAERAHEECPGDPTPGWLAAQRAVHGVYDDPDVTELTSYDTSQLRAAEVRATELVHRFPDDPGALATLGDAYLASGSLRSRAQPFTARRAFQDARTVFERLRTETGSAMALLGAARANAGLGRHEVAADLALRAAEGSASPGRALQLAVRAQEKARRFGEASALAKRLAGLGEGAYPTPTAMVPLGLPLSFGSETLTPLTVSLIDAGQGGGGVVADEGFLPPFRAASGLTDDAENCPEWVWRRDALLAGDAAAAARSWPQDFVSTDPANSLSCPDGVDLKRQIDGWLAAGLPTDVEDDEVRAEVESLMDERQNLLRWAGDLTAARREVQRWALHLGGDTALAHQRLGEIDYLRQDFGAAATELGEAAVRWRMLSPSHDLAVARVQLAQGAALLKSSRPDEAVALLRQLVLTGAEGYGYQSTLSDGYDTALEFARISYYAASMLGDHELATNQDAAAAEDFRSALLWSEHLDGAVHFDAVRNSAAIAALGTGDTARAIALSRVAVEADPRSPVYLMTAAEVATRAGDEHNAARQGRAALESDPTAFPAANNLGVVLARQGRFAEASRVLRAAVHANPDYALGWFNLGIVEGRRSPLHVVPSQGALGRAISLDPAFADRPHRVVLDTTTYRTRLDISKPIPAGWSFAGSQGRAPVAGLGLLAAVLAGIGLVSLRDSSPSSTGKDWLERMGARLERARAGRRLRRPVWAVVATVGAFLLAFWREPLWPWTGVTYAVCLVALVGAAMVARWLVARHRVTGVVHATWSPGVLVGLVSGTFGAPIAPLPVVRAPAKDARVAVAAPLTLAVLSLALLLEAALLHTPLAASLCIAAFIMAGSVLLPVKPLDGARAGAAGVVGAAGLLGAVLVLGFGLV